jgi:hypothetical protein
MDAVENSSPFSPSLSLSLSPSHTRFKRQGSSEILCIRSFMANALYKLHVVQSNNFRGKKILASFRRKPFSLLQWYSGAILIIPQNSPLKFRKKVHVDITHILPPFLSLILLQQNICPTCSNSVQNVTQQTSLRTGQGRLFLLRSNKQVGRIWTRAISVCGSCWRIKCIVIITLETIWKQAFRMSAVVFSSPVELRHAVNKVSVVSHMQ